MKNLSLSPEHQALVNVAELALADEGPSSHLANQRQRYLWPSLSQLLEECIYYAHKDEADLHILIAAVLLKDCTPEYRKNLLESFESYTPEKLQAVEDVINGAVESIESQVFYSALSLKELVAA